jgi:hypothetical protein
MHRPSFTGSSIYPDSSFPSSSSSQTSFHQSHPMRTIIHRVLDLSRFILIYPQNPITFSLPFLIKIILFLISERKIGIISDRLYALVHRHICVQLYPLAGIAHKGEKKTPPPSILHTSKFCFKARLFCLGICHAIFGTEVESLAIPLAVDIDNIIKLRVLRSPRRCGTRCPLLRE